MERLYEQAMQQYNDNFIDDSKIAFQTIIEHDPSHHRAINMLGVIANRENDIESSIKYMQQALELDPKNGYYKNNLGVTYLIKGEDEKALHTFKDALKDTPNNSEAYCNAGFACYRQGDFESARSLFEKALEYNPNNIGAYLHGANLCRDMNDMSQALGHYATIIKMVPDHFEAHLKSAEIYHELGLLNEALEFYFKAAKIDTSLWDNIFIRATINQIYTKLFPSKRYSFYNNKTLLSVFETWIDTHMNATTKVLEYTEAEGLLALKCAQKGVATANLVVIEPFLASQSKEIARVNAIKDNLTIITKEPSDLVYKDDIKEKVDYLIVDILRERFPSYKDLLLIKNLQQKFLLESGSVCPSRVKMMVSPLFSEALWHEGSATDALGLDIASLHDFRAYYSYERLNSFEYTLLSDPVEVHEFRLQEAPLLSWQKHVHIALTQRMPVCHGIVIWFIYELDETLKIDENPMQMQKQHYFIRLFDEIVPLDDKMEMAFDINYSDFPVISNIEVN